MAREEELAREGAISHQERRAGEIFPAEIAVFARRMASPLFASRRWKVASRMASFDFTVTVGIEFRWVSLFFKIENDLKELFEFL
jgi:hypothetical protein